MDAASVLLLIAAISFGVACLMSLRYRDVVPENFITLGLCLMAVAFFVERN